MRKLLFAAVAALALTACSSGFTIGTPATPGSPAATLVPAAATLLDLAAANNTTVATLVTKGQLFCQYAGTVVAVATTFGASSSVIGKASNVVADVCGALNAAAVPVAPPTNVPLNTVPVVASVKAT